MENEGGQRPGAEYVRGGEVARLVDVSIRTLHRKVACAEFPPPVKLGRGTARWSLRDVRDFLDRRGTGQETAPASRRGRPCHDGAGWSNR
jgi:predicted DNA-binding transcriptional regulator AlpA